MRWKSNSSKRFKSLDNKRRKQIESDSKLINLDETRKMREEVMTKNSLNLRISYLIKALIIKPKGESYKYTKEQMWLYLMSLLKMKYLPKAIYLKKMKLLCLTSRF